MRVMGGRGGNRATTKEIEEMSSVINSPLTCLVFILPSSLYFSTFSINFCSVSYNPLIVCLGILLCLLNGTPLRDGPNLILFFFFFDSLVYSLCFIHCLAYNSINKFVALNSIRKLFCFLSCIYFWLHWVFIALHRLSLVAVSGGYSSLQCVCISLWLLLLLQSTGSRHTGFSSYSTWAQSL